MSAPGQRPVHVPADGGESVFFPRRRHLHDPPLGTKTGGGLTLLEALVTPRGRAATPCPPRRGRNQFFLLQGHMVFTVARRDVPRPPRRNDLRAKKPPTQLPERR